MRTCLLCEQEFTPPVQFAQLFSFKPARKNKICLQCLKQFEKLADNRCSGCDKELSQGFMCSDCRNWQATRRALPRPPCRQASPAPPWHRHALWPPGR